MKKIEPAKVKASAELTGKIQNFWTDNVNAERIYGKEVSKGERGSEQYFKELTDQRYMSHRHLLPWIQTMDEGRSVLEIGSGVGLDTFTIAANGLNVTAIDLTEVAAKTVKSRFLRHGFKGEFLVADACILPFDNNSFDYVYSFGVLHHTADTEKSIQEVFRVLRPGGEARIMLYHRHSLNEVVHRITRVPFEEKDHICPVVRRFTIKEVAQIFSSFSSLETHLDYVYGEGYGRIFKLTPDFLYSLLSKYFGWHIMIKAVK